MKTFIAGLVVALLLSACNGSDSSDGDSNSAADVQYVTFDGNDNGEWVLDASSDQIRFRTSGEMEINGAVVDGYFYADGQVFQGGSRIGVIVILQTTNGRLASAAGNNLCELIDFYGSTDALSWVYVFNAWNGNCY